MPHQFALEYQRNRLNAIAEQVRNYINVEKQLTNLYENDFKPKTKHPFLSEKMFTIFGKLQYELKKSREDYERLFTEDIYFERVTRLIPKISNCPTDEDLTSLHEDARKRFAALIPPGYADLKEKGEPAAYGDYIGWNQLIELAGQKRSP